MRQFKAFFFVLFLFSNFAISQKPSKPSSVDIYEDIKKLNFLGSVLYVAAHPDDENTRLISYFSNKVKARTAYLSLTRGDGGQNLIGPEIRESLGVIRTQELLAARRIDGGEQFFTRANDFGYSKHPDETLKIWNKDQVLHDVVLAIREFKPDVIINRFDHRTPGRTHGHHTSSAILSLEAFDLANDNSKYAEQFKIASPWQPKRMFFNTSWWFYGSRENFEKADKSNLLSFDVGTYYPSLGLSNTEIAALSRSQHKSQGFGSTGTRGEQMEYIEIIKGTLPESGNVFEGIDTSWNRVKGGERIGELLLKVEKDFDFSNPSASIPDLVKAYKLIQNLEDEHWKSIKVEEIKDIIAACAGLYLEATAETNMATHGQSINLALECVNRSHVPILLESFITANGLQINKNINLTNNVDYRFEEKLTVTDEAVLTSPYWLDKKGTLGMYQVDDLTLIGKPETERNLKITFNLIIENTKIPFSKTIVYKTNDPVKGEVYKPFEIVPEASAKINRNVIIFDSNSEQELSLTVTAHRDSLEGFALLCVPEKWKVFPEKQKVSINKNGNSQKLTFTVFPPTQQSEGYVSPIININEKEYTKELISIDYDHIPLQTILLPSESKVVKLDISFKGKNIAYIEGAGDLVPESLKQIGYSVTLLNSEDINQKNLATYDAVVLGVRAYNTIDDLKFKQDQLFEYVKNGGNLIVQYNTSFRLKTDQLAPYDLKLSRDRVTDENSEVILLNPEHPALNYPNKITKNDFDGWVQERGLYFPNEWSEEFTPLLGMSDPGETQKKGSLLVAQYGDGYFVYTGLSFFRELPAGVPGAFRLFTNLLSLGKMDSDSVDK